MNLDKTQEPNEAALKNFQHEQIELLNAMYDQSVATCGSPLEFRLFDTQICGHLDFEWLSEGVKDLGISQDELRRLVDTGIIRKWCNQNGQEGFLLYTPEQVKTLKRLRDSGAIATLN